MNATQLTVIRDYTLGALAQIAERSPGYSVAILERGKVYEVSDLRFERSATGRCNRAVVLATVNGSPAILSAAYVVQVRD